ncbi:mitochondrial 2-oxodicarboxylate carrier [Cephus cinctus]|uniref:Mitochondrial 2-oxodicarboxylate carrier n=1 Tax=Cephus cinctus TaxID=211228 RepID=A0AAJ7FEE3_CEPCN|nr:mitochondrial 2-oxodicarboxylate carrier [Cephus cinctus]XP_015587672.1 mitochondrial 2-oxodicarboxylate carrier [Cephus cinctus]XP_015587673.1 mitochondrial 2-oxodicarboxylate carrier [Cephus cinctus]XP_024937084.1 mitochondrial 2-oxodicarboxylate carrier [Cephus cinctus]XP_024937085.1 mitochondrial 2-oxodicarboxylate carrier [Cephus cinctus]XP_024937086.1 mitochondrial 2-oxodicarboxylate carrier [Cephus cinctus]XP_024937087.1 mitochondrial 2-oxodicarboxylate carrier [Cephus cinctus]
MSQDSGKSTSLLKQACIQIGAGGSAGFVEVCIMHPMDLVKTRFQLQVKTIRADPAYYTGIGDCMKKMYRNEGLGAFWKGILPPIVVETPKRAVKFFTFEQYKQFFLFGANTPTPLTFSCAGFFAGVTEGILVNPFEVIKVQLQSNRKRMKDSPSTSAVTREIIRKYGFGLNGLNKGLTATVMRNAVFNSFYFGFYHSVKGYIPICDDPWLEFFTKVGIGFTSGTLASCLNIPFDVAKSRIQGAQGQIQYNGTLRTISIVYQQEGFGALYKGLLPKILRLGPGGAIMLVVYDYMHTYLTETFAD